LALLSAFAGNALICSGFVSAATAESPGWELQAAGAPIEWTGDLDPVQRGSAKAEASRHSTREANQPASGLSFLDSEGVGLNTSDGTGVHDEMASDEFAQSRGPGFLTGIGGAFTGFRPTTASTSLPALLLLHVVVAGVAVVVYRKFRSQ
jgi:hypothetical protein